MDTKNAICDESWLPAGKSCALCFSIDDIHPATSSDAYEAGGDLGKGALGLLEGLGRRHAGLKPTLFVTADWREISPAPTRKFLAAIPLLRDHVYLARRWPAGTMSLQNHPQFVAYLNGLANVEIAMHGLHHISKGPRIPVEFQKDGARACARKLSRMLEIFAASGLRVTYGMCPPGWSAPPALIKAMSGLGFKFLASARDIRTPVSLTATNSMSGLPDVPLFFPALLPGTSLVHIPTNFQATSAESRAFDILEMGGLLSIKAHIVKSACGYVAADGLDENYAGFLDRLFDAIDRKFGDKLWWASMGEVADRLRKPGNSTP